MSIRSELQKMMTSTERGTFLTEDKKLELEAVNEGIFSNIGTDISGITKSLFKTMKAVKSKVGTVLQNAINKIDIANFKKETGIKNIQELDQNLSTISVNNPEFPTIMKDLFIAVGKAKKTNKELYETIAPIFDKHMERMITYYLKLYEKTPDEKQKIMYYSLVLSMLGWLDKDRNSRLRDTILTTMSQDVDKKSIKEILPDIDKIDLKTHNISVNELLRKMNKDEIENITEKELKKMTMDEIELYVKEASRVAEEMQKRVEQNNDIIAGGTLYTINETLPIALKMLNRPAAPGIPAKKPVPAAPIAPAKNPIPAAPATAGKQNPIAAGKKL